MTKKNILFVLIIGFTIFLGVIAYFQTQYKSFLKSALNTQIIVEKGDNSKKIAKKLCKNMKDNCFNIKTYLYFHKHSKIIPGTYIFSGENIEQIFKQLEKGPKYKYIKFTILPGWTKFDIVKQLKVESGKLKVKTGGQDLIGFQDNSKIFLKLMTDKDFIEKMKNKYPILNDFGNISSLEGFIYPDTYFFKKSDLNSSLFPQLLIKTSLKNFSQKWKKLKKQCNKKCNPYNLTNYEVLILSSIVEKEEKNDKNKPLVADVFLKRYKNHWKLGADWTLCYGLKVDSKKCQKYMWNKYLKDTTNKYNTRAVLGLPPTPVGNPTIESIKAVLFPSKNSYWYYLHDKNGKIHFAKNASQHNVNKNLYLK